MTTTENTNKTIEFTPAAVKNINAMQHRCEQIGADRGHGSTQHVEALTSLVRSLVQVVNLGGKITAEDELSLYCLSFIEYGVIFHADRGQTEGVRVGTWSVHS